MIEFLEKLALCIVIGAAVGAIVPTVVIGFVWLVLTIDRALNK